MPTISTKGQNMPSSPIRKLVPFAEKAREEGAKEDLSNLAEPVLTRPAVSRSGGGRC